MKPMCTVHRVRSTTIRPRAFSFTFYVLRFTRHASPIRVRPCLFVVAVFFASSAIATTDSPYQSIVDRNIFGLRPPPPPPSNEPPKPPIPPITLTGITTILGKKLAYMLIQLPPKPGEQAKPGPTSFTLSEGERDGEIEVVSIDDKNGSVKVSEFGTITNVTFGKLPSTPAPPTVAGGPGGIPSPNPLAPGGGTQRSIPGLPARTLRLGNNPGAGNNAGNAGTQGTQGTVNGQGNLGAGVGSQPNTYSDNQTPGMSAAEADAAAQRSPEENVLLYEANRLKNEDLIKAGAKIPRMPQHPWLGGSQGQGQQQPQ